MGNYAARVSRGNMSDTQRLFLSLQQKSMMRRETGDGGGRDDGRDKCLSLPFLENFHENFRVHALSHLRNDPSGFGLRTRMMLCVSDGNGI